MTLIVIGYEKVKWKNNLYFFWNSYTYTDCIWELLRANYENEIENSHGSHV